MVSNLSSVESSSDTFFLLSLFPLSMASVSGAVPYATPSTPATVELEVPAEIEVEMESEQGQSKTTTKISNISVNQDVKFEWMKVGK